MSTINRLKVPCSALQGLLFDSISSNISQNNVTVCYETIETNLESSLEHDKTFDDIDLLEDMNIDDIESPNKNIKARIDINTIRPTTIYRDKVKLHDKYNDKIKG